MNTINKTELANELAKKIGASQADCRNIINSLFGGNNDEGIIAGALRSGDVVNITGFGRFYTKHSEERVGTNPRYKQDPSLKPTITIPARTSPKFKAGSALRGAANND